MQTVETIMLSIISMLSSPNDESPAGLCTSRLFGLTLFPFLPALSLVPSLFADNAPVYPYTLAST